MLPSHRRVLGETEEIVGGLDESLDRRPLATAALVKDSSDSDSGDLIVFDPTGSRIVNVSPGVRRIHSGTPIGASEFIITFERAGKYTLARFKTPSLEKVREKELVVPELK